MYVVEYVREEGGEYMNRRRKRREKRRARGMKVGHIG
jgi:hypothetical protein